MAEEEKKRKHTTFDSSDDDDEDNKYEEGKNESEKQINSRSDKEQEDNNDYQGEGDEETPAKRKRKRKRKKKNTDEGNNNGEEGENNNAAIDKFNSLDHTVYVEGIPFDCTEDEVQGFFADNGCGDVIQMRLPRWQDSGRLRGYGHVVFDSTSSRSRALKDLNGKNLKKRYLTIQEAKPHVGGRGDSISNGPRVQPADCRTVFVKNLPYNNITEDDILDIFRSCGKIVDGGVRLARNYQTKQLKGFGYIEFKNPEGAYSAVQRAAKSEGIKVGGRMCYVDYEESAMKGSFRTAEGKLWQRQHGSVHNNSGGRGHGVRRR